MQHPPTRRHLLRSSLQLGAGVAALAHMGRAFAQNNAPPEVQAQLPQAGRAGGTRMRFLGLSIYDASLWVAPGFEAAQYAAHPIALELRYLRSLSGKSIAERSLQEMRRGGPLDAVTEQAWLQAMVEAFPDVKDGDRITGLHMPGAGTRFVYNGALRATVADPAFGPRFFGIWLAPWTSEPRLRSELLAGLSP
ncbi:chalcone isomerase family protein [Rhodoferax sp.]|uniref:chalcone isomerase family protein n=1 Tax=Rhodoferax sp. TaxID=50421 RepID=UPI002ACE49A8|nr:chalcone isomerase family protein [Rhodoferax sp.]MDZ7920949.1 chalcone isomerase family protein [Rhodoferax sp.]